MNSKTLAVFLAALATLQFLAASSDLADLTSPKVAVWLQLIVGAVQAFMAIYIGRSALMPADPQHPDNLTSNQLDRLANKAAARENA
jgi:membrane protein implicated in regulation of membrane protease activity